MHPINGFKPIADNLANVLILGSMPSNASLQKQQYYGHQRNAFWPIMFSIFNHNVEIPEYELRKNLLLSNNLAVWDVLQSCHREGSLDTAIKMDSLKVNDFYQFFNHHTQIYKVCFNGVKAETIYRRYILPDIKQTVATFEYVRLPSTSPAHASMSLQQKTERWKKEITVKRIIN